MSNERSPRGLCSTTMGISGTGPPSRIRNPRVAFAKTLAYAQPYGCIFGGATMEQDDVMRREIVLPGGRERVWALVADPDELATWLLDELWLDAVEPGARGLGRAGDELRELVVDEVEAERRLALR